MSLPEGYGEAEPPRILPSFLLIVWYAFAAEEEEFTADIPVGHEHSGAHEDPGDGVDVHEGFVGRVPCEGGAYPDDTEDAGAKHGDDCRQEGIPFMTETCLNATGIFNHEVQRGDIDGYCDFSIIRENHRPAVCSRPG